MELPETDLAVLDAVDEGGRELTASEWKQLIEQAYDSHTPLDMMSVRPRGLPLAAFQPVRPYLPLRPYPRSRLSPLAE
jgi:hypothetical protein